MKRLCPKGLLVCLPTTDIHLLHCRCFYRIFLDFFLFLSLSIVLLYIQTHTHTIGAMEDYFVGASQGTAQTFLARPCSDFPQSYPTVQKTATKPPRRNRKAQVVKKTTEESKSRRKRPKSVYTCRSHVFLSSSARCAIVRAQRIITIVI